MKEGLRNMQHDKRYEKGASISQEKKPIFKPKPKAPVNAGRGK
jgi:hypothetical protein